MTRLGRRITRLLILGLTLAGGLAVASVIVFAVLTAFKAPGETFGFGAGWIPKEFQWANVLAPFDIAPFERYFANSAIVGVSVTVLNVVTCTAAGYSFSKCHYPGRNLAFTLVLATLLVPLEILYVPLYKVVFDLGWVNSFAGLIIPAATSAFGIFLMKQAIDSVPDELLEAARIDGAGELRTLVGVVAPAVAGPMAALALLVYMMNWDSYFWPLLVSSEENRTLPVGLAAMQSNNLADTGVPVILMAALLAVIPTVLLFIVLQRRFVEGINMTAGIR